MHTAFGDRSRRLLKHEEQSSLFLLPPDSCPWRSLWPTSPTLCEQKGKTLPHARFVRIDNLMAIYWSFLDAGRFPVDIYPGWLRVTLSTAVPVGVAVTLPAQAISGRLDLFGLAVLVVGSIAAFILSSLFWRVGLRSYTGASA